MTVGSIMRRNFICVEPGETLEQARQTMRMAQLRHLLVTSGDRLVGILSYRRILELLLASFDGAPSGGPTVGQAMKRTPAFATPETTLAEAADRLLRYGIGCLPVLQVVPSQPADAGRVVGIVTEADLLRAAYARRQVR